MCWYIASWPAWMLLMCDMLRQWQCVWRAWLYTLRTMCMAKCYWIVYCHKSQTFQWPCATIVHPLIHPSSCSALSDVLVCWALSSVTSVSWARDFKRSTCLSISSAPLSQPSLGCRERERERRGMMRRGKAIWQTQSSGHQVCPWHCLWDRPGGRLLSSLQALHRAPTASLHSPWAKLHFAQPYWFFWRGRKSVAGWWERVREGRGEMEKSKELSKALTSPWLHLETRQPC